MRFAVLLALMLVTSWANAVGVALVATKDRILDIPEIGASFVPVPMRIGAYIAPEAAEALARSDLRNTFNGNLLTYGKLGPGILSGVTESFPKAFAEVYILSDFPHVLVDAADFDAVVVFESAAASGHTVDTGMMEPINDVLLNVGVYSPAGERLLGYQVIASTKAKVEWDLNIVRATSRGYTGVVVAARNAVRLALLKFPAKEAYTAAMNDRAKRAGALAGEEALRQRAQEMKAQIAAKAPRLDGTPRDALEWATGMAQTVNTLAIIGAAVSAGLTAVPAASGLATVSGAMSNVIANANAPGSTSGGGAGVIIEFLGGVASAQQQRASALAGQQGFTRPNAPEAVCQQMSLVGAACKADECRAMFQQAAKGLACGT